MTDPRICSVDGCGKPVLARGWCSKHYQRIKNGGSLDTRIATSESVRSFIKKGIECRDTECLFWPYGVGSDGRPYTEIDTVRYSVCRLICETLNGPPIPSNLHAAHSCGKGHLGCVNGWHLYWATASENNFDRVDHGTMPQGTKHHWSKLTEDDVFQIKLMFLQDRRTSSIARVFNVCPETIGAIRKGKTWKHVQVYYDL